MRVKRRPGRWKPSTLFLPVVAGALRSTACCGYAYGMYTPEWLTAVTRSVMRIPPNGRWLLYYGTVPGIRCPPTPHRRRLFWETQVVECKEDHDTILRAFSNKRGELNVQVNQGGT